ncbi:MAG: hypothetical protein HUJ67_04130 [Ruminiclostridium sp.]|nr:hypothetical protein [Ruminiclostridium sp.]
MPSREELEDRKGKTENLEATAAHASREAGLAQERWEESRRQLREAGESLLGASDPEDISGLLADAVGALEAENDALQEEEAALKQMLDRRKQLAEDIPALEKAETDTRRELLERETKLAALATRLSSFAAQMEKQEQELEFFSRKEAEEHINLLRAALKTGERLLTEVRKAYEDCRNQAAELETKVKTLEEQLQDVPESDLQELREEAQTLRTREKAVKDAREAGLTVQDANRRAREGICSQEEKRAAVRQRWNWVRALSNTANGTVPGKDKVMLETYIQMTWFDRILARANLRLMTMTSGRYELRRRRGAENQRSQSGLELNVLDHYKGAERSVKTLSGGESFQASLALALGLADEMQAAAGGVRLDALFVDEGFGSLDDEALEQAVRTLHGLAEGNKLVGIISHVSSLKTRIDRQIVVSKVRGGSSTIRVNP